MFPFVRIEHESFFITTGTLDLQQTRLSVTVSPAWLTHGRVQGGDVWTVQAFCEVFHITVALRLTAESVSPQRRVNLRSLCQHSPWSARSQGGQSLKRSRDVNDDDDEK